MTAAHGAWIDRLRDRLERQRAAGLRRAAAPLPDDPSCVDLTTNDYLRLRRHPRVVEAAQRAAAAWGAGSGASRLAGGTTPLHVEVETRFARLKRAESAALLPTGFMANLAALSALPQAGDLILLDKRCHASLVDAARLATARGPRGACAMRTFAHNDAESARRAAQRHLERDPDVGVWIVAESVYSMDGDAAPIAELTALRDALAREAGGGACLILDEAHATGILGPGGAGLSVALPGAVDVCISTASKALGSQGGIITGAAAVREAIDNFARAHIYTTAIAPPIAGAILAALDLLDDEPWRRERLAEVSRRVRSGLRERDWPVGAESALAAPIAPLIVGESEAALALSRGLAERGVRASAIRPPTVAPGAARVRLSLHCALSDDDIERILEAIGAPAPRERAPALR